MRRFQILTSRWPLWTTIVIAVASLYHPNTNAQSSVEGVKNISVFGARPLSDALVELEDRHHWLVTYEDAYYEYQPDLEDRTAAVSRAAEPSKGARFFFAPIRPFVFDYQTADVPTPQTVLANLVESYYTMHEDYEYRLLRQGLWLHVIPASSRNAKGERVSRRSRLDVRVTIPDVERTVEETLDEVMAAVGAASGIRLGGPSWAMDLLKQTHVRTGAQNEIARDVLMRALEATGRKVRWHLLCNASPAPPSCGFNVRMIE